MERKPRTSRREKEDTEKAHKKLKLKCHNYMEDARHVDTYHQVRAPGGGVLTCLLYTSPSPRDS